MFEKTKVGNIEVVKPDKESLGLMMSIISQNERVLKMNEQLMRALLQPVITETTLSGEVVVEHFPGSPEQHAAEQKKKRSME